MTPQEERKLLIKQLEKTKLCIADFIISDRRERDARIEELERDRCILRTANEEHRNKVTELTSYIEHRGFEWCEAKGRIDKAVRILKDMVKEGIREDKVWYPIDSAIRSLTGE